MSSAITEYLRFSFLLILLAGAIPGIATAATQSGFTSDGVPYQGELDAPVVLVEYSDYLCPFCARYHSTTKRDLIEKYVNTGKLRLEFRHFPLAKLHPLAWKGHEAVACAGEQGIEPFWTFHDTLFKKQKEWSQLPDSSDFLAGVAKELGLDQDGWQRCIDDRSQQQRVEDDIALGESHEFSGTPTFQISSSTTPDDVHTIVGARATDHFSEFVEALLAGKQPPKPPEKPKPELPAWAKTDALAIDPERPGFTVSGDPTFGDADARLVIVEFTDYQCPACARHAAETQPAIDEQLIETGKVRWVSKQLPLPEHANAIGAAAAAICAGDQGEFYAMHKALFLNQQKWSAQDNPDSVLVEYAVELNLDIASFTHCLTSREAVERIVSSVYEANSVTRTTPVFVVLDGEAGRPLRGAREPDQFVEVVEKHLEDVLKADQEKIAEETTDDSKSDVVIQ